MKIKKEMCCGCYNCYNICPKKAITMEKDEEGFFYPKINDKLCVNCNACEEVCPIISKIENDEYNISLCFGGQIKEKRELLSCSSGGIATSLSKKIIEENGVVAGVAFSDSFLNTEYILCRKKEELERIKGSKYIQARKNDVFQKIKTILQKESTPVLFIGTPCDVFALKIYLKFYKIDLHKLFLIDLICHGPTSELVLEKYVEESNIFDIKGIYMKNKNKGWEVPTLSIQYNNKFIYNDLYVSDFGVGFLNFTRPSCFKCKFKENNRVSDITIGDFWGCSKTEPFYNKYGVSAIIVHSLKGKKIIQEIKDVNLYEVSFNDILKGNWNLVKTRKKPYNRKRFSRNIQKRGLHYAVKYVEPNWHKLFIKFKKMCKKIIKGE